MIGKIMEITAGLLVIAFILVAAVRCTDAEAQQKYLTCRNNAGEIIHIAPPNLCPYGYWQI
jgi:hypothetical protein